MLPKLFLEPMNGSVMRINEGSFCVSMEWLTAAGEAGRNAQIIGIDLDNSDRTTWVYFPGRSNWMRIEDFGSRGERTAMIRAKVYCPRG